MEEEGRKRIFTLLALSSTHMTSAALSAAPESSVW
jgi:hypothetical protein